MAIYHLRASMISRSQGRSATAAIAYRVAERIEDRRTGLTFDYAKRGGVDHTEILAPDHAPDWVCDRSELWNRVEESETRKNSQVAREVRVALPAELTHDERVALVREFAQEQFVDRGMVADIALHAPGREGDERNHHAHILLTTREIGPEGFTAKNRDWNAKDMLEGWREAWARDSNAALERVGIEDRVDHRTLVAQRDEALELAAAARERGDEGAELRETVRAIELDRPPLPQLSPGAWQMKERGIEVGRVGAWHEAKARAAEVMELARDLASHVRDWLDRAADRVLDRLGSGQGELALAGGRDGRVQEPDLATRLKEAWEARQRDRETPDAAMPDRDAPDDLAARLREAAQGIDREALADRAAALREGREAEERQVAEDAARERELERQQEIEKERDSIANRDRDRGHSL
ncbi:MobQ family relaxase [Paracoccus isoporae]|nr:MobQ family relaxase [Paracoccus isoporae]